MLRKPKSKREVSSPTQKTTIPFLVDRLETDLRWEDAIKARKKEASSVNVDMLVEKQRKVPKWSLEKHDTEWLMREADIEEHTRR